MLLLLLTACAPDPVVTETRCDGHDDDYDGSIDEGLGETWYADNDGDGYGTNATAFTTCTPPAGFVRLAADCDDTDAAANPGATETCAGPADEDCDGVADPDGAEGCVDTWPDGDGDGLGEGDPACVCAPGDDVRVGGDCDGADVDRGVDCTEGVAATLTGDRLRLDDPDAYWSLLGAGDFGADDAEEQLALVSTDGRFAVARVPSGDTLLSAATIAAYAAPTWSRPVLGDLDGEGRVDLFAATGTLEGAVAATLSVTPGPLAAPDAAFTGALEPVVSEAAYESLFVADADGDGAAEGWYVLGTADIAGQTGAWRLDPGGDAPFRVTTLTSPGDPVVDTHTRVVPLGDLDGDGVLELGSYTAGALAVFPGPNAALPSAADATIVVTVPALDDVVPLGDIDADGRDDVGLRETRIWVVTTWAAGDLAAVAATRIGPESDTLDDSALFVSAGDVGGDGTRALLVSDTFWPVRTGAGNLRGALYVFDTLPMGVVDVRAAERRVYAESYSLFGAFPTVLDDGRVAVGAPLEAGEGSLGAVWLVAE